MLDPYDVLVRGAKRFKRAVARDKREWRRKQKIGQARASWKRDMDLDALFDPNKPGTTLLYDEETGEFTRLRFNRQYTLPTWHKCPETGSIVVQTTQGRLPLNRIAYCYHYGVDPGKEQLRKTGKVLFSEAHNGDETFLPKNALVTKKVSFNPEAFKAQQQLDVTSEPKKPKKDTASAVKADNAPLKARGTPRKRTFKVSKRPATNSRVSNFREEMNALGIVQAGFQIPKQDKEEISLFVAYKRARYYVSLLDLPLDHHQRILLAERNRVAYPTHTEMARLEQMIPSTLEGEMKPVLKALRKAVNDTLRAVGALQAVQEDIEDINWSSQLVAYSYLAKYYHDYITWVIEKGRLSDYAKTA